MSGSNGRSDLAGEPSAFWSEYPVGFLTRGFALVAAVILAGIVLGLVGYAVDGAAHERERGRLHAVLQDPLAPPPAPELLRRHMECRTVASASVLAVLGAVALVSAGGAWRAGTVTDLGARADEGWAWLALGGTVAIVLAGAWQHRGGVRSRELRNSLTARWPIPSLWRAGAATPGAVGPVLRGRCCIRLSAWRNGEPCRTTGRGARYP